MKDYRKIVPRTPPEGLREEMAKHLDTHGLTYEAMWVEEDLMGPILEKRRPRKIKMVRVRCSACGGECILPWAEGMKSRYGFIDPGEGWKDRWGDQEGEPMEDGDSTLCPMCKAPVQVIQAARMGRNGWMATSETGAMTASVLQDGALALTGWRAQLRVHRDGHEEVAIDPMEAYVFDGRGVCKLTGWVNAYSGHGGYYIQVKREWGQPRDWSETWGEVESIYGLTSELVERSSLPHCKLVEYMSLDHFVRVYPVAYLRLYQMHQQVENLLVSGLPMLLAELIAEETRSSAWRRNRWGQIFLEEIDWDEREPAKMLGLNREELRMAQDMGWCAFLWRLYIMAREKGERLSEDDLINAHRLGDEGAIDLVEQGPVGKSIAYLLRQIERYGENEETDPYVVVEEFLSVQMLLDYWNMCEALGMDLSDKHVRFPRDLCLAHDQVMERQRERKNELLEEKFRERAETLEKFSFQWDGLIIRAASSQQELNEEGKQLSHCVGTYGEKHASGKSAIFFIRRVDEPGDPFFTLELDEVKLEVLQNRGKCNCARTEEVKKFEAMWMEWIRAGCRRDKDGRPVLPDKKERCA